ncbi:PilZ domain-containing protein [Pseudomonas guariconensis]|uniref:PilZ domain-containing protein n=1 Tax=Pseudomonas TaxID=286 RepID=UPI001CE421A8|nr:MULTISPECIES: PilZ domain-containing protein [Pseudomonas]MCO7514949.1 PilZ domain-containing protein [Pseudomonas putida]MCO7595319.1 PilZ domain-containing protein [Pseudomonas guariconensis]MCO7604176.1 PilZ domain-containing protein [Pseudomonas guariconensis]MCO7632695.1 PilZ domain-containing protein [Pseudomonas guariconensis]MCU7221569.1 PilZ domain-containing protein [Pseudomonas brassicacearum]
MSSSNTPVAPGKTAANIVHEAIDERQYVRTRMNARVRLSGSGQAPFEAALQDISLGGMGLLHEAPLKIGSLYDASILLRLNQVDLSIDGKIRIVSQRGSEVGAQFVDLDAQKRDILRYLINAYMSGEIADINGLFNVMQRENYIKERKQKYATARTPGDRLKAMAGTLLYTAAGVAALGFVAYKGYLLFFRIPAVQAQVATNAQVISMPDNGYVKYLLPAGATEVHAGQPLASISTQLATSFTSPADMQALADLAPGDLQALLGRATIETVINSPCDCQVYYPAQRLDGYGYKQAPLMHLLPKDQGLFVRANVPFDKLADVDRVRSVDMQVFGLDEHYGGKVVDARVDEINRNLALTIQPDSPLPAAAYQKAVAVDLYLGLPFGGAR